MGRFKKTPQVNSSYLQLQGLGHRPKVYLNDCTRMSRNLQKKKNEKTGDFITHPITNCGVFEVFCIWVQSSNDPNIDPKFPREHRRLGGLSLGSQLLRRCSLWRPRRLEWYMKITIDWKRLYISYDYIICCIDKYMFIHIYTRLYVNIERNTYD